MCVPIFVRFHAGSGGQIQDPVERKKIIIIIKAASSVVRDLAAATLYRHVMYYVGSGRVTYLACEV